MDIELAIDAAGLEFIRTKAERVTGFPVEIVSAAGRINSSFPNDPFDQIALKVLLEDYPPGFRYLSLALNFTHKSIREFRKETLDNTAEDIRRKWETAKQRLPDPII